MRFGKQARARRRVRSGHEHGGPGFRERGKRARHADRVRIRGGTRGEFETGTALTATNHRDLIGTHMRAKYAITNDADNTVDTSFTFSLIAVAM